MPGKLGGLLRMRQDVKTLLSFAARASTLRDLKDASRPKLEVSDLLGLFVSAFRALGRRLPVGRSIASSLIEP